jgi:hypothetical protein
METKQEKMRPVLLVAFGATVFVLPLSFQDFKDPLASAFAVAFALMMGSLLVFAFEDRVSRRLRYAYFVAMIMALVAGAAGFPITLLEKAALNGTDSGKGYYVVGIQGVAAVACFAVGLAVGQWVLPSVLPHNRRRGSPSLLIVACTATLFPILLFLGLYWARMVAVLGSSANAVVFTAVHSIGLGALPAMFLWQRSRIDSSDLPGSRYFVSGLALGFASAVFSAAVMEMLSPIPTLRSGLIRLSVVEAPTYLTVYGSVLIGLLIATYVSLSAARHGSAVVISRNRAKRKER